MNWFEELTGFEERSVADVRELLHLEGGRLTSRVDGRSYTTGVFSTPSLAELRSSSQPASGHAIAVREVVDDVRRLHCDPSNANAVFQVASQFNCLEMASPDFVPEDGVGIYQNDPTQGPACSICAGAGTIYRNYFAPVGDQLGQTTDEQVDCLEDLMGQFAGKPWRMVNGYCFPSAEGLAQIENHLAACTEDEIDLLRSKLRVGVQSQTAVTIDDVEHLVTQVFCSALPIAYCQIPESCWRFFPRLILDATYEATFHAAVENQNETGCNKLFLTLVGGGVFGNKIGWILSSIQRSLELFASANLDVSVVSYGSSNSALTKMLLHFNQQEPS